MQKKSTKSVRQPKKSSEIPASMGALQGVRNELKSNIAGVRLDIKALDQRIDARFIKSEAKMDSRFADVDSRFAQVDARFTQIEAKMDSRFAQVDARFTQMDANFTELRSTVEEIKATSYRMLALIEEQNARNKIVLDGYAALFEKQNQFENRLILIEKAKDI